MRYFLNQTTSNFDINTEIFDTIRYNVNVNIDIEINSIRYWAFDIFIEKYRKISKNWFLSMYKYPFYKYQKILYQNSIPYRIDIFHFDIYKYCRYFNPISYRIENFRYPKIQFRICLLHLDTIVC